MENILSNIARFFFIIIILSLILGLCLGALCSSGMVTIAIHPAKTKEALRNASTNLRKNYKAFFDALNSKNRESISNDIEYSGKQEQESKFSHPTFTYKVKKGETLYDIGLKYGVHWKALMRINKITDPDNLHPNDKLIIPLRSKYSI